MIIRRESGMTIDFEGLTIVDYTAGAETSSSVARITVPPGEGFDLAAERFLE